MAGTNNLNRAQVTENQDAIETSINDSTGVLDAKATEDLDVDVTAGNVTLTAAQHRENFIYKVINATSSGRKMILAASVKGPVHVYSDPATNTQNITVEKGTGVFRLAPGESAVLYSNGGTDHLVALPMAVFDIATYAGGVLDDDEMFLRLHVVRAFTIPDDAFGSKATSGVAATASTVIIIKKNGSSIGTITFAVSGTTGTFSFTNPVAFAIDDIISLHGPATADVTCADISVTLKGYRS